MKKRIFSGIQPSGDLHVGNYLGAIKNWVALQDSYDSIFCVVDLHAITVPQDPKTLQKRIREIANIYLAAGVDPKKSTIFVQSDRPEHSELAWILNTIAYMGEMKRMTQFKDKAGKGQDNVSVGLFDYPVLMAADILLYNADLVPVGKDQFQHIELTRDLAERFNKKFGKTFNIPKPYSTEETKYIMGLDDATKKMAKSAGSEYNYIALRDSEETVIKKISRAQTDSDNKIETSDRKPAITNLLNIYSAFSGKSVEALEKEYQGKTYKDFKNGVTESILTFLKPFQEKLAKLEEDPSYTDKILRASAKKLEPIGKDTLAKVKKAVGLGL